MFLNLIQGLIFCLCLSTRLSGPLSRGDWKALTWRLQDDEKPENTSNSASTLVSTLIPSLIIAGIMILVFAILRRSHRRQYMPRTYLGTLRDQERTPEPTGGFLGWIPAMFKLPDTYVLHHHSLDAYLLLRYLKIATTICFVGCLITWPVLFPVNATGGKGNRQLDMLTFGNVTGNLNRYYAHTFIAWIFIGKFDENLYGRHCQPLFYLIKPYLNYWGKKN